MGRLAGITAVAAAVTMTLVLVGSASGAPSPPVLRWSNIGWSPTVQAGQTASQEFTLTNQGGQASGKLSTQLQYNSGSPTAFSLISDGCTNASLGPGRSCTIIVQYAPVTSGQRDEVLVFALAKNPQVLNQLFGILGTST